VYASWLAVYRALLLVAAVMGIYLIYLAIDNRGKSGWRPLLVLLTGGLVYVCTKLIVSIVRGTPSVFVATRLNPIGAGLAAVGFFLLVIEYAGIRQPVSKRTAAGLLSVPAVASSLAWIDIRYLWRPIGRDPNTVSGYAWELTSLAVVNQLYMNLLMVGGIALLVRFGLRSRQFYNRQVGALVVAGAVSVTGNLAYYFGYVRFNPTPVAFVLAGSVIAWAMLRGGFLDIVPVGRGEVVDNLEAGVVIVDDDHRLVDTNEMASRMFGFRDSEPVVGRQIDDVFADHPTVGEIYWQSTETSDDVSREFQSETDERYFELEVVELPGRTALVGRALILRDITDRTQRKRALEEKNEKLEQLASVVSHDIRNPLSVMHGRVQLVRDGNDVDHQLDVIESNIGRIDDIVEDMLVITRGDGSRDPEPVGLAAVARQAWEHVDTGDASLEITGLDGVTVAGDRGRLVQLFENVFRNAAEHAGRAPTVRTGPVTEAECGDRGFFIADDGPGIPDETREAVLEDGYTTSEGGTGLGLTIVSTIVEEHGWQMRIADSESGGARFEITGVRPVE
jgi:PAS domain S-box-containing protein